MKFLLCKSTGEKHSAPSISVQTQCLASRLNKKYLGRR